MNAEPIFRALLGYRVSAVLRAAIELDVFSSVEAGKRTAPAVASACGGTPRSMRILLDAVAVVAPELLKKRGDRYALTPLSRRFLVRSRREFLGPLMPLYGHRRMWDGFFDLASMVRAGTSTLDRNAHSPDLDFWEDFARATAQDARLKAEAILPLLGRLEPGSRILDVACGSGQYGATLARACRDARLTLFDQRNVLAETRRLVNVPARYLAGDLFKTPFGGPYDVVVASHVYHHFKPADCLRISRKLAAALRPGGRLLIHDFIPDEARRTAAQPLMFAVTMLVWTRDGDAYRESEYRGWLRKAGFGRIVRHRMKSPGDVILATR